MKVNIFIKILSNCINNYIEIFDNKNKKLVSNKVTNEYVFESCERGVYKIVVYTNDNCIVTTLYVFDNYKYIIDARKKYSNQKILINVYDQNYSGLIIEKGELSLWKTNMISR